MIRELIVVGLYDQKLSEKLQLDPKFCLTKRINQARQSEAVKKRQALLRNDFQDVEDSKKKKRRRGQRKAKNAPKLKDKKPPPTKSPNQPSSTRCEHCGNSPTHKLATFPAKDATCFKCSKRGHSGTVCKSSKTVGELQEDGNLSLGEISSETNNTLYSVDLLIGNSQLRFEIDTATEEL